MMRPYFRECQEILRVLLFKFKLSKNNEKYVQFTEIVEDLNIIKTEENYLECFKRCRDLHEKIIETEFPKIAKYYQFYSVDEFMKVITEPFGLLEREVEIHGIKPILKHRAKQFYKLSGGRSKKHKF
jgi:hypothetical protein